MTVLAQGDIGLLRSLLTEENDFFKLEYKIKREHHSERTLGATMNKPDPDIKKIAKVMADVLSENKKEVYPSD